MPSLRSKRGAAAPAASASSTRRPGPRRSGRGAAKDEPEENSAQDDADDDDQYEVTMLTSEDEAAPAPAEASSSRSTRASNAAGPSRSTRASATTRTSERNGRSQNGTQASASSAAAASGRPRPRASAFSSAQPANGVRSTRRSGPIVVSDDDANDSDDAPAAPAARSTRSRAGPSVAAAAADSESDSPLPVTRKRGRPSNAVRIATPPVERASKRGRRVSPVRRAAVSLAESSPPPTARRVSQPRRSGGAAPNYAEAHAPASDDDELESESEDAGPSARRARNGRSARKSGGSQRPRRSAASTSYAAGEDADDSDDDPLELPSPDADSDTAFRPSKRPSKPKPRRRPGRPRKQRTPSPPMSDEEYTYSYWNSGPELAEKTRLRDVMRTPARQANIDVEVEPPADRSAFGALIENVPAAPAELVEDSSDDYESSESDEEVDELLGDSDDARKSRSRRHQRVLSSDDDATDSSSSSASASDSIGSFQGPASVGSGDEIDESEKPILDRHWEMCHKCLDSPGWQQMHGLMSMRGKLRKQNRKSKGRVKHARTLGGRVKHMLGQYDETEAIDGTLEDRVELLRDQIVDLGGWLECCTCSASFHWGCLPSSRQKGILRELNEIHEAIQQNTRPDEPYVERVAVAWNESLNFVECGDCHAPQQYRCMLCHGDQPRGGSAQTDRLFRCIRCRRGAHYECCRQLAGDTSVETTAATRQGAKWRCVDCEGWGEIESVLAWRPSPDAAKHPQLEPKAGEEMPAFSPKDDLKREYLVKFKGVSFRETQWVPHAWLSVVASVALLRFLQNGSRIELDDTVAVDAGRVPQKPRIQKAGVAGSLSKEQAAVVLAAPKRRSRRRNRAVEVQAEETTEVVIERQGPPRAAPDAQERIPLPWRTPDRVLDVFFRVDILGAAGRIAARNKEPPNPYRRPRAKQHAENRQRFKEDPNLLHIDEVDEALLDDENAGESLPYVAKLFVKWEDVPYEFSTWENGPDEEEQADIFDEYLAAFKRYLSSRKVNVPLLTPEEMKDLDDRRRMRFTALRSQPSYVRDGQLLDFQLEGLNWLRFNWFNHQPGILADEMGLGKTIQMIAFLGSLQREHNVSPFVVVVPNSTMGNWVREFESWLPSLHVVPYFGSADSRDVIEQYELYHEVKMDGRQRLKCHVLLISDTAVRQNPAVLRRVPRWEVMVVDEGQSLKGGESNLLFRRLSEVPAAHRLIMTGTPLNNNIGELFNLLKWLDPGGEWDDVEALKKKYEVLTPELIEALQPRLKPFFLRRLKADVVNLPPKTELIVPVSLRPVQKRLYKSVLESNIEDIQALTDEVRSKQRKKKAITNMNNILMQLRKCIQHPYLVAPNLEIRETDRNYVAEEELARFVDASGKLMLLKRLLPKLKERGHRVLLFSQFVINLDLVEYLLDEEGYKYLRLDGSLGNKQRQKGIDAFNAPNSEFFIYILSTRAGGVGINLATADTVIVFDPDFNPHADMQAIARAHRIGQVKHVLVFTLVGRNTAEERIVEAARRKMVLDHLIVQNLDNEDSRPDMLENIIKHGAQALFAEGGVEETEQDIRYTDEDLDTLIVRAETEEQVEARPEGEGVTTDFSFARVWELDKASDGAEMGMTDIADQSFWHDLLETSRETERLRRERQEKEELERGSRRRIKVQPGFYASTLLGQRSDDSDYDDRNASEQDADFVADSLARSRSHTDSEMAGPSVAEDAAALAAANQAKAKRRPKPKPVAVSSAGGPAQSAAATAASAQAGAAASPGTQAGPPAAGDAAAAPPQKRGPGRPRKHPLPEGATGAAARPAAPTPPRAVPEPSGEEPPTKDEAQFVLEQLPRPIVSEILERRARKVVAVPLQAPDTRPQLTPVHAQYFAESLGFPYIVFRFAFSFVGSHQLPANVRGLPNDGAAFLDANVVREHLIRASHAIYQIWCSDEELPRPRLLTAREAKQLQKTIGTLQMPNLAEAVRLMLADDASAPKQHGMISVIREGVVKELERRREVVRNHETAATVAAEHKAAVAAQTLTELLINISGAIPQAPQAPKPRRPRASQAEMAERRAAAAAKNAPPVNPLAIATTAMTLAQAQVLRQATGRAESSAARQARQSAAGTPSGAAGSPLAASPAAATYPSAAATYSPAAATYSPAPRAPVQQQAPAPVASPSPPPVSALHRPPSSVQSARPAVSFAAPSYGAGSAPPRAAPVPAPPASRPIAPAPQVAPAAYATPSRQPSASSQGPPVRAVASPTVISAPSSSAAAAPRPRARAVGRDLQNSKACPICRGTFHFLGKCPTMADLGTATQRYVEMANEALAAGKADPMLTRTVQFMYLFLEKRIPGPTAQGLPRVA